MRKPYILFASGVFPPSLGGPATILSHLVPALVAKGYKCKVVTFGDTDETQWPFEVTRAPLTIKQPFRACIAFLQTLNRTRHAQGVYALDTYTHGLSAAIATYLFKKPFIMRFTGDVAWESAFHAGITQSDIITFNAEWHGIRNALRKKIRTFILKRADTIITDCNFLKKLVGSYGIPIEKVVVINNAIETLPSVSFNAEEYKEQKHFKKNVILSLGRLVPWKGNVAVIEAFQRILKQHPDSTLAIAGDGPEYNTLQKSIIECKLEDNIKLLGPVRDPKEKSTLYAVANVYIQNTFYEGMSNALLEAMAQGKAVITTHAGGNPEFVTAENGVLIPYNDTQAISEAMHKILSEPSLQHTMGQQGIRTVQQFTWDTLIEKNEHVIRDICHLPS